METGGHPEFGVCAAVDVHYLPTGGAQAAAMLAAGAVFAHVLAERTAVIPQVRPYRPGEFYLRELPPLRAVLDGCSGLGLLVVDGYADLDPDGRPGLGAHAHAEFGIPVIGVAKSRFRTATHAVPVVRGSSARPLFVTAAGCPAPTRQAWSDGWLDGTGCPTPCAAPTSSHGSVRRSQHDRPPARLTYADARNAAEEHVLCAAKMRRASEAGAGLRFQRQPAGYGSPEAD
jgi:deoxyribonuclease V